MECSWIAPAVYMLVYTLRGTASWGLFLFLFGVCLAIILLIDLYRRRNA